MRATSPMLLLAFHVIGTASYAQDTHGLPTACALLSRIEVESAGGTPVAEGELRFETADVSRCQFNAQGGGKVAILVRRVPSATWISEQIERMDRGVRLGTYRAVSSAADRSFLLNLRPESSVLCVFAGNYYLQVSLLGIGGPSRAGTITQQLAGIALLHLRERCAGPLR